MRGFIYEFNSKAKNVGCMDETDFFEENNDGFNFAYNVNKTSAEELVSEMLQHLKNKGAEIGKDKGNTFIRIDEDFKKRYFSERFTALGEVVANLTLDEFSRGTSDYRLTSLIDNDYADCAYYNGSIYTFDSFIKKMVPGYRYYVGAKVVMMC